MDRKKTGLSKTNYEISDLHTIFSMSYLDEMTKARDYGTGAQYTMLEAHTVTLIERTPGITVTEISKAFARTKSAISQLITRLEKKGLIIKARKVNENQKLKGLFVTPLGRELSIAHVEYDNNQVDKTLDNALLEFTYEELNAAYRYMEYTVKNRMRCPDYK